MKTYKVIYKETLIHAFYVEANNEEEAQTVFEQGLMDDAFDLSDGEVDDAIYTITEDNDDHHYHYVYKIEEDN